MALKLRRDNPYSKGKIVKYKDDTLALFRGKLVYNESPNDKYHIVGQNERLDTIAYTYYKNSKLWWVIADINQIFDPFTLTIGTTLLIPSIPHLKAYNLI